MWTAIGNRIAGSYPVSYTHLDNDSKKHNEIFYDTNNYVELLIEIDDEKYELTRYIGCLLYTSR